jgi:hypothetical protein
MTLCDRVCVTNLNTLVPTFRNGPRELVDELGQLCMEFFVLRIKFRADRTNYQESGTKIPMEFHHSLVVSKKGERAQINAGV